MVSDRETATMPESSPPGIQSRSLKARWGESEHARGLLLIGLFKLTKAVLSIVLGIGALRLLHRDVSEVTLRVLDALRIDPERHIVALIMEKANLIEPHQLRDFSIATFCYAALCLTEGIGLMLEKRWAEYLTVVLTASMLPWECFELTRHFTVVRVVVLLLNILVLVYLVWLLRRKRRLHTVGSEGAASS